MRFSSPLFPNILLSFLIAGSIQSIPLGAPPNRSAVNPPMQTLPRVASDIPVLSQQHRDPAALRTEGQELLSLSQSLQPDIEQLNQGVFHKDVIEKLKRIEKISKHLRGEIIP